MSLTQVLVLLSLYDGYYINTKEYAQLPTDYPLDLTLAHIFRALCNNYLFISGHSKSSMLSRPSYRYVHAILSRSVTGRGEGVGSLSQLDLLYLHSMNQRKPLHLGYIVPDYLRHQS